MIISKNLLYIPGWDERIPTIIVLLPTLTLQVNTIDCNSADVVNSVLLRNRLDSMTSSYNCDRVTSLLYIDKCSFSSDTTRRCSNGSSDTNHTGYPLLLRLSLSYGNIVQLEERVFSGLLNLLDLALPGNRLTYLHELLFANNSRLTRVDVSRNQLVAIPKRLFQNNHLLREIIINDNRLVDFIIESNNFRHLGLIKLCDNRITYLDKDTLLPIINNNHNITIEVDIPHLKCYCGMEWLLKAVDRHANKISLYSKHEDFMFKYKQIVKECNDLNTETCNIS